MAFFFSGDTDNTTVNPAVAGFGPVTLTDSLVQGRWYDIVNASGVRAVDIASANVTVTDGTTPGVEGTDYKLDLKLGRVFVFTGSAVLADAEDLVVTLAADAGAAPVLQQVLALTKSSEQLVLKFVAENPANNDEVFEIQFHSATLSPEGDFALVGDDWTSMQLTGVAQSESIATGSARTMTITTHANAAA